MTGHPAVQDHSRFSASSRVGRLLALAKKLRPVAGTSGFLTKAARLASGHAAGYAVTFAISPLLARLYGPEAFGVYALFVLCVSCLGPVATLRFDQAIALVDSRRAATVLASLSVAAGAMVTVLVLVLAPVITTQLTAELRSIPWTLVALLADGIACMVLYQVVAGLVLREGNYKLLANMRICFALASSVTHLAVPLLGGSILLGLAAGQTVGFAAGAMLGSRGLRAHLPHKLIYPWKIYLKFAHRYRSFAQYGVPASMASNFGMHVPALLMASLYGLEAAGMFTLAQRVFLTPLTLVTSSFSRVYLAEASKMQASGQLRQHFDSTIRTALWITLLPACLIAAVAPWAFPLVFGAEWGLTGWVCTMLAPMAMGILLSQISGPAFDVSGRQHLRLTWELVASGCVALSIWAAYAAGWSFLAAVAAGSLAACVVYVLLAVTARQQTSRATGGHRASPKAPSRRQAA